jgi:hypothetical protein
MSATIANPKDDLISQATERRTIFARLALRERSQQHPVAMFAAIVTAAFVWTLAPGSPNVSIAAPTAAPVKMVDQASTIRHQAATTQKTSRLPQSDVDRACKGQGWGGESAECLKMIGRENGKAEVKVRMIADAAPAGLNTPNIF